tara:strand:+ start:236 stop:517 length:282 start_codon:yes stop_codon:yes gene_type:complete
MSFLEELESIIKQRDQDRPEGSYIASLFEGGLDRILKKVGEEAGEVIIASKNNDPKEISHEVADLLFHLLVLLRKHNISLETILSELESRHKS